MYYVKFNSKEDAKIRIIFIHGWANTNLNMLQLATLFVNQTENYGVDLMGFGKSPTPNKLYTSEDYANDIMDFIKKMPPKRNIIIGHSHGGRVAIESVLKDKKLDKRLIDGIVLLGGAGIPVKYSPIFKIRLFFTKKFSFLKKYFPFLVKLFSSKDYNNANGIMKDIFKQIMKEDLREKAKNIDIPTLLLYGDYDTATPIYMGQEYKSLIKNSKLEIIYNANHYDLLGNHASVIHNHITKFIRENF